MHSSENYRESARWEKSGLPLRWTATCTFAVKGSTKCPTMLPLNIKYAQLPSEERLNCSTPAHVIHCYCNCELFALTHSPPLLRWCWPRHGGRVSHHVRAPIGVHIVEVSPYFTASENAARLAPANAWRFELCQPFSFP